MSSAKLRGMALGMSDRQCFISNWVDVPLKELRYCAAIDGLLVPTRHLDNHFAHGYGYAHLIAKGCLVNLWTKTYLEYGVAS